MGKRVYITWHYTTHGVAYLKHVLSEFYLHNEKDFSENISWEGLDQEKLQDVFSNEKDGFTFDKIIYLTAPQESFDILSSRRFYRIDSYKEIEEIKPMIKLFDDLRNNEDICYDLDKERKYIKEKYPKYEGKYEKVLWKLIHHYSIDSQIKWLLEDSNLKNVYKPDLFENKKLNIKDLRDIKQITQELKKAIGKLPSTDEYFINVSLGSAETQVAWHILADYDMLPKQTRFITTYDDKTSNKNKRFKLFSIKEIPTKVIQEIGENIKYYNKKPQSPNRELVNIQLECFIKSGFSILLLGERGTGKSHSIKQAKELLSKEANCNGDLIEVNCASFTDDNLAESKLFGYKKGAFTGAYNDTPGMIEEAKNGILFMDEVHNLSKPIQEKLMKAFQTDEENMMSIRRIGENKEERKIENVHLIFATNKTIPELREVLLPDFYDRIVQHVINIPPLRETQKDIETDWSNVWTYLKFEKKDCPKNQKFFSWIKQLPLYGNYRDLQKIAMYYNAFNQFDKNDQKRICESMGIPCEALSYTKEQFKLYHSPTNVSKDNTVSVEVHSDSHSIETLKMDFLYQLYEWASNQNMKNKDIANYFGVGERTINNWKNKRTSKN